MKTSKSFTSLININTKSTKSAMRVEASNAAETFRNRSYFATSKLRAPQPHSQQAGLESNTFKSIQIPGGGGALPGKQCTDA